MFHGQARFSAQLLSSGREVCRDGGARVEVLPGARRGAEMMVGLSGVAPRLATVVPPLLAPLLGDSPCTSQLHARYNRHRYRVAL